MIIGYIFTAVYIILLLVLTSSVWVSRKSVRKAFSGRVDWKYAAVAVAITLFFVIFSLVYVHPVEQLYFDENIYQGIALNILHNGNALWCQYGGAYTANCQVNQLYHDPVEWSFYLAISFFLFGAGIQTAYGMQLLAGALSILFAFLLGSLLLGKRGGIATAVVLALIPEMLIWSRTQAVPDLAFMTFSTLAFLFYVVYDRVKTAGTLAMFLSALGIALYMRIEGVLLVPIFILIYLFGENRSEVAKRLKGLLSRKAGHSGLILFLFFLGLVPQIYYIAYQLNNLDYGAGQICNLTSNSTFSIQNFMCNAPANFAYFLGNYNSVSYYPTYFSPITTIIAVVGAVALVIARRRGVRKIFIMLGLWIFVYYLFFDFFYAGSVTYGVDVRFMLQLYPAIAIFAAAGLDLISEAVPDLVSKAAGRRMGQKQHTLLSGAVFIVLIAAFAVSPFMAALNITTISPQNMPQEGQAFPATNFIYANYNSVPANCLVFSFTPDIWYQLNRSAAQIGYLGSSDANFTKFASGYSCYVLDYGYWCVVPPYQESTCLSDITQYNVTSIVSENYPAIGTSKVALYWINDYNST